MMKTKMKLIFLALLSLSCATHGALSQKKVIVVLGQSRSGTSVISRLVVASGGDCGNHLSKAAAMNPKGFWEDEEIVQLNNELMDFNKSYNCHFLTPEAYKNFSFSEELVAKAISILKNRLRHIDCYSFKSPRTSLALPFWKHVFRKLGIRPLYIICLRNPIAISHSFSKVTPLTQEESFKSWEQLMNLILRNTQGEKRLFIKYEDVLKDPEISICEVSAFIGESSSFIKKRKFYKDFLDANLNHSKLDFKDALDSPLLSKNQKILVLKLENLYQAQLEHQDSMGNHCQLKRDKR